GCSGVAAQRASQGVQLARAAAGSDRGADYAACAGTRVAAAAAVSSSTAALQLRPPPAGGQPGAPALALRVSHAQRRGAIERGDERRRASDAPGLRATPPLP